MNKCALGRLTMLDNTPVRVACEPLDQPAEDCAIQTPLSSQLTDSIDADAPVRSRRLTCSRATESDHPGTVQRMEPIKPSAYNNDYLTLASAVDVVEDSLHQLAQDEPGMSRLAVASSLDHGAAAWKLELAYQITRTGLPVKTLYSNDALRRVDLLVRGEAFEFRSTFSTYTVTRTAEQNRQWLRPDVQKILDSENRGASCSPSRHSWTAPTHDTTSSAGPPSSSNPRSEKLR